MKNKIPETCRLSPEDIRYLKPSQLSRLTGFYASDFSAWQRQRRISESSLNRMSQRLCISKVALMAGLELRRQDATFARLAQEKADCLLQFLQASA